MKIEESGFTLSGLFGINLIYIMKSQPILLPEILHSNNPLVGKPRRKEICLRIFFFFNIVHYALALSVSYESIGNRVVLYMVWTGRTVQEKGCGIALPSYFFDFTRSISQELRIRCYVGQRIVISSDFHISNKEGLE